MAFVFIMKTHHKEEQRFSARQDKSYDKLEHEKEQAEAAQVQTPPPANTIERDGKQIVVTDPVPPSPTTIGSAIEGNRNAPPVPENFVENPMDKARVDAFNKGKEDRVHQAEANLENAKQ